MINTERVAPEKLTALSAPVNLAIDFYLTQNIEDGMLLGQLVKLTIRRRLYQEARSKVWFSVYH
jgi:hypothetical protein